MSKKIDSRQRFGDFRAIRKGDRVAIESRYGPCSGGAGYGITDAVVEVTPTEIVTPGGGFSRDTGDATRPPWAYGICWWRAIGPALTSGMGGRAMIKAAQSCFPKPTE